MGFNLKLYTPKEVAKFFRVSKMTISRLINAKEIKVYKVGGQYRISDKELKRYLLNADTAPIDEHAKNLADQLMETI